jgi:hypothetical protein
MLYICIMNIDYLVHYLFQLCLVIVTFGFLWGIIKFIYTLFKRTSARSIAESYSLILISYILLIDVLIIIWSKVPMEYKTASLVLSGSFLVVYFLSQLQGRRFSNFGIQMSFNGVNPLKQNYHFPSEIIIFLGTFTFFIFLSYNAQYASNPISSWFYTSILGIDNAPIIGWIFKLIGAFMLIFMIGGLPNLFRSLLIKTPVQKSDSDFHQKNDSDHFDSFEEL